MNQRNHCTFEGSVGRDSTAKQLSKQWLTTFSVAVNQGKDKPPMWLNIKHFNEHGAVEVRKGQKVKVTGRLFFDQWTDKDNYQRQSWGVIADEIEPIDRQAQNPPHFNDTEEFPF